MAMIHLGSVVVDLGSRRAGDTSLTPTEVSLMGVLAEQAGQTVERGTLYRDVWGYRHEPQGRALDFAILRLRKKLVAEGAPEDCLPVVRGVGYRLDVAPPAKPAAPQGARDALVPPLDAFVGRDDELTKLTALLRNPGWVTVIGPAGVGKTRLALEAMPAVDARLSVDVSGLDTSTDLRASLQAALGVERALNDAELGCTLHRRGVQLLLLDGADQLAGAGLADALLWLRGAPDLCVVATSRRRTEVPGEALFRLNPLASAQALDLFRARAAALGQPVVDTDALDGLIGQLDGLPLALELAAARSRVLDLDTLSRAMADRFRLLRQSNRSSLESAIAGSWDALPAIGQEVLGRLTTIHGAFPLELAEALLDDLDGWALDHLEVLVDHSLVQVVDGGFRLLDSIRVYAHQQLSHETVRRARNAHTTATASLKPHPSRLQDFEAAATWGEPAAAAERCALMVLVILRHMGDREQSTALLADWLARPDLNASIRAAMYRERGWHAYMAGDAEALHDAATSAIQLGQHLQDPRLVDLARVDQAIALQWLGDHDVARKTLLQVVDASSDPGARARALNNLGGSYARTDPAAAEAHWVLAESASQDAPSDVHPAARMLRINAACQRGDARRARALLDQYAQNHPLQPQTLLWQLFELCRARIEGVEGDSTAALERIDAVLAWASDIGNEYTWSTGLVRRAECLRDLTAYEDAGAALDLIEAHGLAHHHLLDDIKDVRSSLSRSAVQLKREPFSHG